MRGHVRKRGTTWSVVVDVGRDPDTGRRRQKWHSGYKRKRDAETALSELLTRLDGGAYVEPSKITAGAYLTGPWLAGMRTQVRPSTLASYEQHVRSYLVPKIGHVLLQRLTADQLNAMYADLLTDGGRKEKGLSTRTVRYVHQTVRRALGDAENSGLVPRNVATKARPPKQTRNRDAMRTWTGPDPRVP